MGRLIAMPVARLILAVLTVIAVFPLLWTLLGAFKSLRDIVTPVPKFIFSPTLENFGFILKNQGIRDGLMNSLIVVSTAVAIGAVLGIPAAYTISRHTRRWRSDLQFFVLSLRFLPPVAIAIPFIVLYLQIGLYDSYVGLIIVYLTVTISTIIWLSTPAFDRVPIAIEEAAAMEGAGPAEIFWKIALPVAAPTLFGAVVFTFVLVWNELLIALSLTARHATLPVAAASITSLGKEVPWGVINASTILLVVPPLFFIVFVMQFINRVVRSK